MTVNIDVVAQGSERDAAILSAARRLPGAIRCDTVANFVNRVLERAGTQTVRRLRIFAHGNEGIIAFGHAPADLHMAMEATHLQRNSAIYATVIHHQEVDGSGRTVRETSHLLNRHDLRRLSRVFDRRSYVELHVCNVARGARGRELLHMLDEAWCCTVFGSAELQTPGGGFEGTRVQSRPGLCQCLESDAA